MQLINAPYAFQYDFVTADETEWRSLQVSTTYPTGVKYLTIPWNVFTMPPGESSDNFPQLEQLNGWTFLYGPCWFDVKAQIQFYQGQPHASGHALLYQTTSQSGDWVKQHDNWEWEVIEKETHSSHLMGAWSGLLPEGNRLRLAADYWHATASAKVFKANVQGEYWRI